jgi:hypothetical protein
MLIVGPPARHDIFTDLGGHKSLPIRYELTN